jgi:hypothetical protein
MRLETGVVQEGNDWPGVFIRGDDAFHLAMQLREALRLLPRGSAEAKLHDLQAHIMHASLAGLADILESCNTQNNPEPQRVRLEGRLE